jgi:hypothetical protein
MVAIAVVFAAVAGADTVTADGDTVTLGNQGTVNLGIVSPGATLTPKASFTLTCTGKQHPDLSQRVVLSYDAGSSNVAPGGTLTATNATIGPMPSSWPDDTTGGGTTNCPSPLTMGDNGDSTVTITAPTSPGNYSYSVVWDFDLDPDGEGDAQAIIGSSSTVQYSLTVSNPDADGDGIADASDNCATVSNPGQANNDGDAQGDACDADDDNDGFADATDNCEFTANPGQTDSDGDGIGDACDNDNDNDGVGNAADNCPLTSNSDQTNTDGDAHGDACDADDDNDSVADGTDNCPLAANGGQEDNDHDDHGDVCDADDDNDTVADATDNCQLTANADQANNDGDAQGDVCDSDDDNDTVPDSTDNCQLDANTDQANADGDALGNACDSNAFVPALGSSADDDSGDEGDTLQASGSFTDQDGNDSLTLTSSDPDHFTDNGDGTWSWSHDTTDNGSATVTVTASDGEHATVSDSFTWTAQNVAPSATFNAPSEVNEGSSINISLSNVVDPGADTYVYRFSCDGGTSWTAYGAGSSHSCPTSDDGSRTVKGQVRDDDLGESAPYSAVVTVKNVAPSATFNAPSEVNEGSDINISLSTVVDPGADTYVYRFSCDGGTSWTAYGAGSSHSCPTSDDGSRTVKGQVRDDDLGESAPYSAVVTVKNVAPLIQSFAVTGASATACLPGNTVNISFGVADPATEAFDPITGSINWGDTASASISGRSINQSHSYAAGSYTIQISVNDGDGGAANKSQAVSLLYNTGSGILQPINADGTSNFKLGSTIPVKIKVLDCSGNLIETLGPKVSLKFISAANGSVNETIVESVPDAGDNMRFDAGAMQYIYNLSTKRSTLVNPAGAPLALGRYTVTVSDPSFGSRSQSFDILK